MKNLFKRNKPEPKPDQGIDHAAAGPSRGFHVFAISDKVFKVGMTVRFEEEGVKVLEPAWEIFRRLNVKLAIEFDPYVCHDGKQYWNVTFTPEYHYRGRSYGLNGIAAVKEIGFAFQSGFDEDFGTPNVTVQDDGRVIWRTTWYPEAKQIEIIINEVNRQVADIIRDFGRTEAIMGVLKKAAQ